MNSREERVPGTPESQEGQDMTETAETVASTELPAVIAQVAEGLQRVYELGAAALAAPDDTLGQLLARRAALFAEFAAAAAHPCFAVRTLAEWAAPDSPLAAEVRSLAEHANQLARAVMAQNEALAERASALRQTAYQRIQQIDDMLRMRQIQQSFRQPAGPGLVWDASL